MVVRGGPRQLSDKPARCVPADLVPACVLRLQVQGCEWLVTLAMRRRAWRSSPCKRRMLLPSNQWLWVPVAVPHSCAQSSRKATRL